MANYFFGLIGLFILLYTFTKVKKKLFSEVESFFWVIGAVFVFILSLFPQISTFISKLVGIEYAPSFLFLCAIIFIVFLLFRQSQYVSLLNSKTREIIQQCSLLEEENRTFRERLKNIEEK